MGRPLVMIHSIEEGMTRNHPAIGIPQVFRKPPSVFLDIDLIKSKIPLIPLDGLDDNTLVY